ncbi:lysine exporter LysO family protein [Halanaerobium hydrogeniformans]|uniref:Lysine exporter LysO family protein n=1 Tax=Halanaerobium hydrogeniformans TaxID=656519 RepID=E4RK11_HALHG|nr:lysine exporter LysO family protein [Halanaerobium hydrogeniformans]ADQ15581.1 protein of unknown function DUF340 membrane [Halanaerobium hydrogeniformans]
MDFYLILFFLFSGIFLGWKVNKDNYFLKLSDKITKLGLVILLAAMGADLGSNEEIYRQLGRIGLQALLFAIFTIVFSVMLIYFFAKLIAGNSFNSDFKKHPDTQKNESNMTFLIFISVISGIIIGRFWLGEDFYSFLAPIINYSLALLLFGVGVDIGASREILEDLKLLGWKILAIPLLIAIGTLIGSVLIGVLLGFAVGESAAVGSGFGWYSLSGVLISNLHGAELGSLAFLTNVFRELLTVILIPIVAKYFGSLAAIAPGGATTMDVTLPLIKEAGGESVVIPAFISGAVLSTLVPILVPFFLGF